ncbi:MAG: hypothetical protein HEP71_13035 [Roseivirga sp.]|nr:hypothetical protein [Roseivirga sp.]
MKQHSTNYENTFIEIAEDCPVSQGEIPPLKGDKKSLANLQFEMLHDKPYQYTSDDVFFKVFATRKDLIDSELETARQEFFSKGQPCFRASPLTKRYGWGVHSNAEGKVALYGAESEAYERFVADSTIAKVTAMRTKRK